MTIVPADDQDAWPFVTGPLPDEDVERLLRVVEDRVRQRGASGDVPPAPAWDPEVLDPAATFAGDSLRGLSAPLFHTAKGSVFLRAAKSVLNVPLAILGRPQAHFNQTVRRVVATWADVIGATLDNLVALQRDVAALRARLEELEARLERGNGPRPGP